MKPGDLVRYKYSTANFRHGIIIRIASSSWRTSEILWNDGQISCMFNAELMVIS